MEHGLTGSIVIDITIVFILVLANAFFVASEFALVSVRKTRIDQLAAEGNGAAAVVQRAVRDLDRYIAATQVGITLASLLWVASANRRWNRCSHPFSSGCRRNGGAPQGSRWWRAWHISS